MSGEGQTPLESGNKEVQADMPDADSSGGARAVDEIRLVGVAGIGRHGVLAEERRDGQPFLADLVLSVDTKDAAASDDLTQTVSYADVAADVVAVIEGEPVNLVETLAARIAAIALSHERVQAVTVTVHKPEAPVGVPFTDVQVRISRTRAEVASAPAEPIAAAVPAEAPAAALPPAVPPIEPALAPAKPAAADVPDGPDLDAAPEQPVPVVIAMGGNVGDVRATLRAVTADLRAMPGLILEEVSPLARTAAVLAPDAAAQPDFLNAVLLAKTTLAPMALLEQLQGLENAYGRRRAERWGERTLDLDLILYGSLTSTHPRLSLPHPRASERAFVLVPWAQTDPDAFLPGLGGGPVAALAETAEDRAGVRWLALDWLEEPVRSAPAAAQGGGSAGQVEAPAADGGAPVAESGSAAAVVVPGGLADPEQDAEPDLAEFDSPESIPPEPEQSDGAQPEPVEPDGAQPEPVEPDEAQPEPVEPDEAQPEPDEWEPDLPESDVPESIPPEAIQPHAIAPQSSRSGADRSAPDPAEPDLPKSDLPESIQPQPPHARPAAQPGRASFPPPAPQPPAAPEPQPSADADADADAEWPPSSDEPVEPESAPSPDEPDLFRSRRRQNEPDLPWAPSSGEPDVPRPAPRWQPLRRHDDN